jgi:hypothetical protein
MVVIFIYQHPICNRMSNVVLSAGKMPPRKPMTRCSLREVKLKEENMGEGSSPSMTRQLEFSHKAEPVIKTSTKKAFIQPPTFGDMEATNGSKIMLPQ